MNIIKGLLIKDLLQLKSYKKNFFLSIIIYGIIIIANANASSMESLGSIMIMFLFSVYAMATFSYDEKSKSDRYILTFPLTKKEVILSKYILGILSLIIGAFIGSILSILLSYICVQHLPDLNNFFSTLLGTMFVLSIMQCIQIPFIYKYGAEKGRLQIYIIMMIIALLLGGIYMFFPNVDLTFLDKIETFIPLILLFLIVLNYYISNKLSYKIYSKKEL